MARPTKLTPVLQQKICEAVRSGNYLETAAAFAGINKTTLHAWLRRGGREGAGIYHEFSEALEKALADSEARDVALIAKAAAEGVWQASAWRLERKYPDRWGRRDRIDATVRGAMAHVDVTSGDLSRLSNQDLDALEQIYAKALPAAGHSADGSPPSGSRGKGSP